MIWQAYNWLRRRTSSDTTLSYQIERNLHENEQTRPKPFLFPPPNNNPRGTIYIKRANREYLSPKKKKKKEAQTRSAHLSNLINIPRTSPTVAPLEEERSAETSPVNRAGPENWFTGLAIAAVITRYIRRGYRIVPRARIIIILPL